MGAGLDEATLDAMTPRRALGVVHRRGGSSWRTRQPGARPGPRARSCARDRVGRRHGRGQPAARLKQNIQWKLVDRDTGAANAAIDWKFRVGDQVNFRLVNEMDSIIRCRTRSRSRCRSLLVLRATESRSRTSSKDTVLVRTGETVDILLDVTNPGRWMAHCHIAEHHESGMMFGFDVEP